jgi:hypothetical protein
LFSGDPKLKSEGLNPLWSQLVGQSGIFASKMLGQSVVIAVSFGSKVPLKIGYGLAERTQCVRIRVSAQIVGIVAAARS